jgi:hypothetical protein
LHGDGGLTIVPVLTPSVSFVWHLAKQVRRKNITDTMNALVLMLMCSMVNIISVICGPVSSGKIVMGGTIRNKFLPGRVIASCAGYTTAVIEAFMLWKCSVPDYNDLL